MNATLADIYKVEACALDDCRIGTLNNGKNGAEDTCAEFDAWCAERGREPLYDFTTVVVLGRRAAAIANASECHRAREFREEAELRHPFTACHYREKFMCELEDRAMRDAEIAARRAKTTMGMVDAFFGPALQRARDQAAKIERAAQLAREADDADDDPFTTEVEE